LSVKKSIKGIGQTGVPADLSQFLTPIVAKKKTSPSSTFLKKKKKKAPVKNVFEKKKKKTRAEECPDYAPERAFPPSAFSSLNSNLPLRICIQ